MKQNAPNENDEKQAQKRVNEKFNSITQKVKVENQNQTHNAKKEGFGPQQRPQAY